MAHKLTHLSAVELARLVRTKKASPVEVIEAHLAAIQKINPAVNAFCTVAAEKALVWAREAERAVKKRAKLKPLHGVPVAIKDLTPTADIRTTFGSTLFRDHVPDDPDSREVHRGSAPDRAAAELRVRCAIDQSVCAPGI
jgi:Asp-tRNA(Asn)/Glu-tRNA(Gln) amidotransferase A subunit family amidase